MVCNHFSVLSCCQACKVEDIKEFKGFEILFLPANASSVATTADATSITATVTIITKVMMISKHYFGQKIKTVTGANILVYY